MTKTRGKERTEGKGEKHNRMEACHDTPSSAVAGQLNASELLSFDQRSLDDLWGDNDTHRTSMPLDTPNNENHSMMTIH